MKARAEMGLRATDGEVVAIRGERLSLSCLRTFDPISGSVSTEWLSLLELDEENLISCEFLFDTDDLDAALAELESRSSVGLENACTRTLAKWQQVFMRQDWGAAPDFIAADIVHDDRRTGLQSLVNGREQFLEQIRVVAELYSNDPDDIHVTVLAIRGARLALYRFDHDVKDGFKVVFFSVFEIDSDNKISAFVMFDDVAAAFAELDDRQRGGESPTP